MGNASKTRIVCSLSKRRRIARRRVGSYCVQIPRFPCIVAHSSQCTISSILVYVRIIIAVTLKPADPESTETEDRHGIRAKERSVVTASKLCNSSGEWLQTEHTPVTEPEAAKHESSEALRVGLTTQSCIPCQFQMGESLSDAFECSECSGKPSYNISCDMPGLCISLVITHC